MAKPTTFRHILVLVDGTDASYHAADCAIELARALNAKLTAMAVVDTDTLRQLLSAKILVASEMGELEKELYESNKRHLADVRERAMDRRVVPEEVLVAGNAEAVLPKEVEERKVDLVVIGGFQSRQAIHDLLARQRQQIVDRAVVPILVVR